MFHSNAIKKVVTIGGGNGAHVLMTLLAERGYEVRLSIRHPEKRQARWPRTQERKIASCEISPRYVRTIKTENDQKNDANDRDVEEYRIPKNPKRPWACTCWLIYNPLFSLFSFSIDIRKSTR